MVNDRFVNLLKKIPLNSSHLVTVKMLHRRAHNFLTAVLSSVFAALARLARVRAQLHVGHTWAQPHKTAQRK